MGHFSDTLMAVCSTPSSPLSVVLPADAATLLKFLLTAKAERFRGRGLLCERSRAYFKARLRENPEEMQVFACVIKMYLCILSTLIETKTRHTLGDAVFCRKESLL